MLVPDLFSSLESSSKHVLYFLLSLFLLVALNFTIGLFCFIYFQPFGKYNVVYSLCLFLLFKGMAMESGGAGCRMGSSSLFRIVLS